MGAKYSYGEWEQFADQASIILGSKKLYLFCWVSKYTQGPRPDKRRISNFSGGASAPPDPPFPVGLKASKKSASGLPGNKGFPCFSVFVGEFEGRSPS